MKKRKKSQVVLRHTVHWRPAWASEEEERDSRGNKIVVVSSSYVFNFIITSEDHQVLGPCDAYNPPGSLTQPLATSPGDSGYLKLYLKGRNH